MPEERIADKPPPLPEPLNAVIVIPWGKPGDVELMLEPTLFSNKPELLRHDGSKQGIDEIRDEVLLVRVSVIVEDKDVSVSVIATGKFAEGINTPERLVLVMVKGCEEEVSVVTTMTTVGLVRLVKGELVDVLRDGRTGVGRFEKV